MLSSTNSLGQTSSSFEGQKTQDAYLNYFIGKDQSKWASHVKKHGKVLFKDIYPNIDLEFESNRPKVQVQLYFKSRCRC